MENVSHFAKLDNGVHLQSLLKALSDESYQVYYDFLNSKHFGVPQSRERLFILGFRTRSSPQIFSFTRDTGKRKVLRDILISGDNSIPISDKWQKYIELYIGECSLEEMGFQIPKTRRALERADQPIDLKNCVFQIRSSGIRAISLDNQFPTFAVSHSGGGAMIPVYSGERRHLSLAEMTRLMGFPETFKFPVSRTSAIKQLSNAVCPAVIKSISLDIKHYLASRHSNTIVSMR